MAKQDLSELGFKEVQGPGSSSSSSSGSNSSSAATK
jgi:hypothetical protein